MEKELNCMLCDEDYSIQNPPRLIACGHSLCEKCLKQLLNNISQESQIFICPQDQEEVQLNGLKLTSFPKNLALVKLLAIKQKQEEAKQKQKAEQNIKSSPRRQMKKQTEQNKILPSNINEQSETITLNDSTKETERKQKSIYSQQQCLIHQKPLQIICIKDKTKICSMCAIFGDHKGHEFKSVEQVQKDKIIACDQILNIIQKKQLLIHKLNSPEVKQKQAKQLQTRKQTLSKQIKDYFSKLLDIINLSQKKALDKLSKTFQSIEPNILDVKLPNRTITNYQMWEQLAFKYIKAFQSNNLEQQLSLLNYQKTEQINVVENGLQVLKQLEENCQDVSKRSQNSLKDSITIQFKNDLDIKLATCWNIFTKEQRQREREKQKIQAQKQKDKGFISAGASRAKIHQRIERIDPTISSNQQIEIEKVQIKQPRKISDHNDDLLIEQHKYEEEKQIDIMNSNINIPTISPLTSVQVLDTSGSDAPVKTSENRKIDFSPIQKDNSINESMSSSFVKNIGGKKQVPFKGNILQGPSTKRKSKLKLPEKYQKIYDGILSDSIQIADFTNAQLGDQIMAQVLQGLKGKKVKTLKLIRNKLTDQGMDKIWNYLQNIITLNLSQNLLTDRFIDQLLHNLDKLPHLKSVILSQNKIKQRNVKIRIEEIKKHDITVSI